LEEVSNIICHAGNIHPGQAGAASGKSKNSFSGSVQRGLFTVKQAPEKPCYDILPESLSVIKEYSGQEDFICDVPVITLTTLDKGKDAEENTLRNKKSK
jgi:hypothetical protein